MQLAQMGREPGVLPISQDVMRKETLQKRKPRLHQNGGGPVTKKQKP
jgi:hypothetical protein